MLAQRLPPLPRSGPLTIDADAELERLLAAGLADSGSWLEAAAGDASGGSGTAGGGATGGAGRGDGGDGPLGEGDAAADAESVVASRFHAAVRQAFLPAPTPSRDAPGTLGFRVPPHGSGLWGAHK